MTPVTQYTQYTKDLVSALWAKRFSVQEIGKRMGLTAEDVGHILQNRPRPSGGRAHYRLATCPWCHVDITGTTETRPHRCEP